LDSGGHVFFGRLFGVLAVSRSFGDSKYKKPKTSQNFVSWEPAISIKEINSNHKALIVACDGLWDVLSHNEVGDRVLKEIKLGKNSQQISELLVTTALDKYTEDNVTVITVLFNWDQNNLNHNNENNSTENNSTENNSTEHNNTEHNTEHNNTEHNNTENNGTENNNTENNIPINHDNTSL